MNEDELRNELGRERERRERMTQLYGEASAYIGFIENQPWVRLGRFLRLMPPGFDQ